jgi:DNA-binding transcriptional MerR regulator
VYKYSMSPTNPEAALYTLTNLADLAGVTPRTVRYYFSQGLLSGVGASGPGAKYDDSHLARLRLIKRLQAEHQPLAEIRRRLEALDDAAVTAIAAEPSPAPSSDSALDYIRRVTAPTLPSRALYLREPVPPLAAAQPQVPPTPSQGTPTSPRLERSQWERVDLAPDIELHIRRPLPRSTAKRVDRLIEIARDLLEEDQS